MVCVPSIENRSVIAGRIARFCTCIRMEIGEIGSSSRNPGGKYMVPTRLGK